jgi:hypothetical protein
MSDKMRGKINKIAISIFILAALPWSVLAQSATQTPISAFNPNDLISDTAFSDTQTFGGPDGIQKFLQAKGSVLASTSVEFLTMLKEPNITLLKQALDDPEPNLGHLRTAAELIWDASQSTGLNPQVILVTMEKEESLIDGTFDSQSDLQTALDHAMGFNCGDNVDCWNLFPGFYYQLFGNLDSSGNRYLGAAKSLMKSFTTPGGRGPDVNGSSSQVGQTIVIDNTLGGYAGVQPEQSVTLADNATAALYRYTPHVFNGNYNFWMYFTQWFKYPDGTLIELVPGGDVYIIENGVKQLVPQFVATARAINLSNAITVSPDEYAEYDTGQPLGPTDGTIVQISTQTSRYVFLDNVMHQASAFVIGQRGLDIYTTLTITPSEAGLFTTGAVLPPSDGTVIKGQTQPAVYLVNNGEIELFSKFTFDQNQVEPKKIVLVPDAEIATYTQNGFVPPQDGTLIKASGSGTVYLTQNGQKEPITGDLFKNRGFSFSQVATLSSDEVNALPLGSYVTPADRTFYSTDSETGPLYIFKNGAADSISPFVAKQRGITPDYVFSSSVASGWPAGIPVPPYNGTLVKGDSSGTIYLVVNAQLAPLTAQAFKDRRLNYKKVITLPQAEVASYAETDTITN